MEKVRLGRTELMVTKTSFGALPADLQGGGCEAGAPGL